MPCVNQLKQQYSKPANYAAIYPLYKDSTFEELHTWAAEKGNKVYMKFLITHPQQAILNLESEADLQRIFAYNIGYSGNVTGISYISEYIFPIFNVISIFLLMGFYLFICLKEKNTKWMFPSVLIVIFTINAYLLYNADALEVERHLFITNIMIQFIGIYLIAFILDADIVLQILSKYKTKIVLFKTKFLTKN